MSISGIHGQLLEVTVVGCYKLKDTEWISRQDPYVCLEYASTKFRTRTCTDGGKNPVFQEKFVINLIEGLREINVLVWNSNTLSFDDFIGSGKVQLQDVLARGYDDRAWPLQTKTGRHAGEVKLILHYANAKRPDHICSASAQPYLTAQQPHVPVYSAPTSGYPAACHSPPTSYAPAPTGYPAYPHDPAAYGPYSYPPSKDLSAFPPTAYPPSKDLSAHPPSAYPPTHDTSVYPPKHDKSTHPPMHDTSAYPSMHNTSPYPRTHDMSAYPPAAYPPPKDHSAYSQAAYPSQPSAYPPAAYPPPKDHSAYSQAAYPPQPSAYPPAPYTPLRHASPYPPPGPYSGVYPPPTY